MLVANVPYATRELLPLLFNFIVKMTGTAIKAVYLRVALPILSFPANQATVTVTLTANNDTQVEGDETAILTITDDVSYKVVTPRATTINVIENVIPVITVVATDPTATEAGSTTGAYALNRTGD